MSILPKGPDDNRLRGRGVASNEVGRYERLRRNAESDGWDTPDDQSVLRTEVSIEPVRKAITYNASPDLPFDRSVNPYRGCEHGCVYCFARPGHAWLGLSPGLDFETRLIARPDLPDVMDQELSRPSYSCKPIAIGTFTDPYQPIEKEYKIMRRTLRILADRKHPVAIVTKGSLIERDIDILSEMSAQNLCRVGISVTTLDPKLSRHMEPRVPAPKRRLQIIERLAAAGIPVRVMASPMIPGLTDPELEAILTAAKNAGAGSASWIMLRLPLEVSKLFQDWLTDHYPNRANGILAKLRDMHGGQDYRADWGKRMRGEGTYAKLISNRFNIAVKRLALKTDLPPLTTDKFTPQGGKQLSLF